MQPNVSLAETAKFDALAGRWWDPAGPMAPLHRMNPARTGWIAERIARRFGRLDVRLVDVGCGAGIAAEALAAQGARVLGIDAAGAALAAARDHAAGRRLSLDYREATAETLAEEGARFEVVTALEVIEHVPDPAEFLRSLARLAEPGGLVFVSTINRTARSLLLAKIGAEYVMRLLPAGTHDWRAFVTPEELASGLRGAGLRPADMAGLIRDPFTGDWRTGRDLRMNYLAMAEA